MTYADHIEQYLTRRPDVHPTAFIAPGAVVVGDVTLGAESSVWYQAVLRGDINRIVIGAHSNVQDGAVIHLEKNQGTILGEWVTVGHKAVVHACTVHDEVLVGIGSIILDGAEIGSGSIIGAGAVVTRGTKIPPGSLVLGMPAKVVRILSEEEQKAIRGWAERYVTLSRVYKARSDPAESGSQK